METMMTGASGDLALLVLRLTLASVFLAHGLNHVFGGGKLAGTARWFASLGMRPGMLHAAVASATEMGSAVLLALGLLTPLAAAGVVGVMLVAWITNHRRNGFFIFRPGEGYEYVMTLTLVGVVTAMLGPGSWSLDTLLNLDGLRGWTGLWIVLAAGVGGAVLLLALFWRPSPPAPAGPARADAPVAEDLTAGQ
jgi:putative oxidoreductase